MSTRETIDFIYESADGYVPRHDNPEARLRRRRHRRRHPRPSAHERHGCAACSKSWPPCSKASPPIAAVRAAVIAADGPAFSAGLNLKTGAQPRPLGQRRLVDALNDGFGTLYAWPKPLVAAVNGHAIAGGLILALCADWRVVADRADAGEPGRGAGGRHLSGGGLEVARSELSPAAARRLILLGETLDAARRRGPRRVRRARAEPPACASTPSPRPGATPALPPQAFATIKRELRAPQLARIAAARAGHAEPRLAAWLRRGGRRRRRCAPRRRCCAARRDRRAASHRRSGGLSCRRGGRSMSDDRPPGRRMLVLLLAMARRAGAEQGAVGARAGSAGQDIAAVVQRRQRHRQLHGLPRQAVQAVPRAILAGAAQGDLQGVQREEHRHRRHRGAASRVYEPAAVDRCRRQAAGEGLLPDRAGTGQLRAGLHPLRRRMEADPHQRQAGRTPP